MYWTGNYGIELNITKAQASVGSHQGQCDSDVAHLRTFPSIKRQLDKLDKVALAKELKEYGAWDAEELKDHDANLNRILWLACGDINEGRD